MVPDEQRGRARKRIQWLAGIPEAPMRREAFFGQLLRYGLDDACSLLETLVRDTLHKRKPAVESYQVLIAPERVVESIRRDRLEMMLDRARELRLYAAALWLLMPLGRDNASEDIVASTLLHRDLRDMTLGHRRSLARSARGDTLQKLLTDPDPVVVDRLLANPSVTESQVLAIAARRPTVTVALERVIDSPWIRRYRIQSALAQNPYLHPKRAAALLPLLNRRDLRAVARDSTLNVSLRESAQHLSAMWDTA